MEIIFLGVSSGFHSPFQFHHSSPFFSDLRHPYDAVVRAVFPFCVAEIAVNLVWSMQSLDAVDSTVCAYWLGYS